MGLLDIPNTITVTANQFVQSFDLNTDSLDTFDAYTLTCPYDNVEYSLQEYNETTIKNNQFTLTKYGLLLLPINRSVAGFSVPIKLKYRNTEYTATLDLSQYDGGDPMEFTATKVQ